MNTNQKIRRIGGIVVLLILCGMLLPVFCKNSRAAEVTHYYVYLDDARYEVTTLFPYTTLFRSDRKSVV